PTSRRRRTRSRTRTTIPPPPRPRNGPATGARRRPSDAPAVSDRTDDDRERTGDRAGRAVGLAAFFAVWGRLRRHGDGEQRARGARHRQGGQGPRRRQVRAAGAGAGRDAHRVHRAGAGAGGLLRRATTCTSPTTTRARPITCSRPKNAWRP